MFTYLKVVSNRSLANLQRAGSRTTLKTLYHYMNTVTMRNRENKISHYGEKTKQPDKRRRHLKKKKKKGKYILARLC